jgi:hypothetical protein
MSFLDSALMLGSLGYHVFPLVQGGKTPAVPSFPEEASCNLDKIRSWWVDPVMGTERDYNIGIYTGRFGKDRALCVVDVDQKSGKDGEETILRLELEGFVFPKTAEQKTPNGKHLIYVCDEALKQGVNVLGHGLDIRSSGGYIVGHGSEVDGKAYVLNDTPHHPLPEWIAERLGKPPTKDRTLPKITTINEGRAISRATYYLKSEADLSVEGSAGDLTAYRVACTVKDFGVEENAAVALMLAYWNERCSPPWTEGDLAAKVKHAYKYGAEPPGVLAVETSFQPIDFKAEYKARAISGSKVRLPAGEDLSALERMNREYALATLGTKSVVIRQLEGKMEYLEVSTLKLALASFQLSVDDGKKISVVDMWLKSPDRRSYEGVCFEPKPEDADPRLLNLWTGFQEQTQEPPTQAATRAFDLWMEHAYENIAQKDDSAFQWIMNFFAHLIQFPWEKPTVALVLKGPKGVGKNQLMEPFAHLLGDYFVESAERRYITGNFNSHLERCLLLLLDEAFWSGDKQSDGIIKSLITSPRRRIERKGFDTYNVKNCMRVVVLGNDDWLVPASADERRYAVFEVGTDRQNDIKFFREMNDGMKAGGASVLVNHLKTIPVDKELLFTPPKNKSLLKQKLESFSPIEMWWYECLSAGEITDSGAEGWPAEIDKADAYTSFQRFHRGRGASSWIPPLTSFYKTLYKISPSIRTTRKFKETRKIAMPLLYTARKEFINYLGYNEPFMDEFYDL